MNAVPGGTTRWNRRRTVTGRAMEEHGTQNSAPSNRGQTMGGALNTAGSPVSFGQTDVAAYSIPSFLMISASCALIFAFSAVSICT